LYISLFNSGHLKSVLENSDNYKQLMTKDTDKVMDKPVQKNLI
jgi:hypothetical protein